MPQFKSGLYEASPERWQDAGETFEALLVDDAATYVFDLANDFASDFSGSELTTTGYTRAAVTPSVSWDSGANRWRLTCGSLTFGSPDAGDDAAGIVVYRKVTDDTDSPVWSWHPFAAPEATDGTTFTVTLGTDGVARVGNV